MGVYELFNLLLLLSSLFNLLGIRIDLHNRIPGSGSQLFPFVNIWC